MSKSHDKNGLLSREHAHEILRWVVDSSPADQTEAVLIDSRSYLTRFTKNAVHQNVGARDTELSIRVIQGRKVGSFSTNLLTADGGERALKRALEIARHQRPLGVDLELPRPAEYRPLETWSESTAHCSPERRAEILNPLFANAEPKGVELAGALRTEETAVAVANSRGVDAWQPFTLSELSVLGDVQGSLGYAVGVRSDVEDLECEALAHRASQKALDGQDPIELEPGPLDVVLEPAAVAVLVHWLGHIAFSGSAVHQGTSFLAGNEGTPVMGEEITFFDDGFEDPETASPFDFEGVPKSRVMLVQRGLAKGPVLDTMTAARLGKRSTGHGSATPGLPAATNLFLEAGNDSTGDLIRQIDRGLLVTRFHYVNGLLEPRKARMTGMTKDGLFLIEKGEIVGPVKNMRFNESITEAFSRVRGVSKERERHSTMLPWTGAITVPALSIEGFRFTAS